MSKPYLNNAIIGNSKLLTTLSSKGEILRIFWPNIDFSQNLDCFYAGLLFPKLTRTTCWLHEDMWKHSQKYLENTNILQTEILNETIGCSIIQTDFALKEKDIIIRNYKIKNTSSRQYEFKFLVYNCFISNPSSLKSSLFDFESDSLVHYSHSRYLAVASDHTISGFQLGDAKTGAEKGQLTGIDEIIVTGDTAFMLDEKSLEPGEEAEINLYIVLAKNLSKIQKDVLWVKAQSVQELLSKTEQYWKKFITEAKPYPALPDNIKRLYNRSLLTFRLVCDEITGGIVAAPENDEEFERCGRYSYCWGRDAGFIATALDKCGLTQISKKFYEWSLSAQSADGCWHQRHYINGDIAPSWSFQVDETGSILWGLWQHFETTKDYQLIEKAWESVKAGADFLVGFMDEETGLPKPSRDLWEERLGEHTYSSSAVYGGLIGSAKIAQYLGKEEYYSQRWLDSADSLKKAIIKELWDEESGRFLRGTRVQADHLNNSNKETEEIVINSKGYTLKTVIKDDIIDASLTGISIPFNVLEPADERVQKTVEAIDNSIWSPLVGGIMRYEDDYYIGGNPWIITTLWQALYYAKIGNKEKALKHFNWSVEHCTDLEFLPEQIDKITGEAAWVIPLTWSHAMFILTLDELVEKKFI